MAHRPFKQVDVFTREPLRGNPVAVVFDADDLSREEMQRIANWTNLSETTFVLPPAGGADPDTTYRLRIFTPKGELPFAGHPTLGSAHAWLEHRGFIQKTRTGGELRLVQQCGAGDIDIACSDGRYALKLPAARSMAVDSATTAAVQGIIGAILAGAAPVIIDLGPRWLVTQVASAAACLAIAPDLQALSDLSRRLDITGLTVFGRTSGGAADYEVRSFAPLHGVPEDPVCGSGNGAVALYLQSQGVHGAGGQYSTTQGAALGRAGQVSIRYADDGIWLGGQAVTCVDGVLMV
jgi:PhzF family phenazine biosynthesis protein